MFPSAIIKRNVPPSQTAPDRQMGASLSGGPGNKGSPTSSRYQATVYVCQKLGLLPHSSIIFQNLCASPHWDLGHQANGARSNQCEAIGEAACMPGGVCPLREPCPLRPGSVQLLGVGCLEFRDPRREAFRPPYPFPFPSLPHSLCVPTPSPGGSVYHPPQGAHWL